MSKNGAVGLKIFLKIIGAILLIIGFVHFMSAMTVDRIIEYKEISISSPKISSSLNGYRVAFVTDVHALPATELQAMVKELDGRNIDLLVLGGDFPNGDAVWRGMQILGQTSTRDGAYGIEGNHDDYEELFAAMRKNRIRPLSNSGQYVRENLYIAGVKDLWNREPDVAKAIGKAKDRDFVLLLAHNPDITMQQDMSKVDLTLSGHTHGGQVTFFGIWAPRLAWPGISDYGEKFKAGWATSQSGTPVYVSRGTGSIYGVFGGYDVPIPRVFARPEVTIITLKSQ